MKALKVFLRDFYGRPNLVESFRFPRVPFRPISIPSRNEIIEAYQRLDNLRDRALFLMFASTGLRSSKILSLQLKDIDLSKRMVSSSLDSSSTKRRWVSFWNKEADIVLRQYLSSRKDEEPRVFPLTNLKTFKRCGIKPQTLRQWFSCEMGRLGVQDRYVDAFCGRVPRSVLARHYTDFSPETLKEIYDQAKLKVLS